MKRFIGFAFAAAIGATMVAFAQASVGPTPTYKASFGLTVQTLQPVW
jgi:hypothetical protein